MKTAKWFYDLKSFEGNQVLQGSVTTSAQSDKKTAIRKIMYKHFSNGPIIGWDIKKIKVVRVED